LIHGGLRSMGVCAFLASIRSRRRGWVSVTRSS
jgi:hypothetical protein